MGRLTYFSNSINGYGLKRVNTSAKTNIGMTKTFQPINSLKFSEGIKDQIRCIIVKAASIFSALKKIQEVVISPKL